MGFDLEVTVSAVTVFLQGLLSFLSPCVLPLLPVYLGMLSGRTLTYEKDGSITVDRNKMLLNTLFFVFGIGFAFLLLGLGATAAGRFLSAHHARILRIGGVLLVLLGLFQLDMLQGSAFLQKEARLSLPFEKMTMSPLTAFLMGFAFSFAWTPCVGPALTSVLLLTASAASRTRGLLLTGLYTLGFALPFLVVSFFASGLLSFLRTHGNIAPLAKKAGGVLLILTGILLLSGMAGKLTAFFASL